MSEIYPLLISLLIKKQTSWRRISFPYKSILMLKYKHRSMIKSIKQSQKFDYSNLSNKHSSKVADGILVHQPPILRWWNLTFVKMGWSVLSMIYCFCWFQVDPSSQSPFTKLIFWSNKNLQWKLIPILLYRSVSKQW